MPITSQQAWNATNPADSDEARQASAEAILRGVAANDAYISSRSELEQLVLLARGGQVVHFDDISKDPNAEVEGETPTALEARTVDSTAVTLTPEQALEAVSTGSAESSVASGSPSPDNPVEEVASLRSENDALRAQLEAAGRTPEV